MIGITIAGFDPSRGAGVLRDVNTFSNLGIHPTAVITALTAQNPSKYYSTEPIDPSFIEEQIDSILSEYNINYGKTGMLYNEEIVKTVHKKLKEYNIKYIVDPVMVASSGGALSDNTFKNSLKNHLLKDAILTTPNIKEAEKLTNIKIKTKEDAINASQIMSKTTNTLITGGHLNGKSILNVNGEIEIIETELINTNNTHGSGCTLSAAITSYLIKGENLNTAIKKASKYTEDLIKKGQNGTLGFNY
jgi:hydroxymethylpyrimidine/phosphomethylpyrimidine kinase